MANKQKKPPVFNWYLMIALSCISIFIIALSGLSIVTYFITSIGSKSFSLSSTESIFRIWIPIVLATLCLIARPILARKRQEYRDRVEYDEFGVSRKRRFSSLSADERKQIETQKMIEAERLLPSTVIKSATHSAPKDPDTDLNKLIGLKDTKRVVLDMAAQMEFDFEEKKNKKKSRKTDNKPDEENAYHMCFSGPPGTGKTTVARILTGFLYKYKVIKQNKCIEIDGNTVRGGTPAETTQKVVRLVQAAMGGVLFIDEAYALISGKDDNREAVATLIKYMEDYRSDFVVILAGYDEEMQQLIASNPGFASRIQHYLAFPSYNTVELDEIFVSMAEEQGYTINSMAFDPFNDIMKEEKMKSRFGNARTVRNCLMTSIRQHKANYIQHRIDEENKYVLCPEDICFERGILK